MFRLRCESWVYEIEARLLRRKLKHIHRDWFQDNGLVWC